MQFELPFSPLQSRELGEDWLLVGGRPVRLWLVRNRRARRYVLRLRSDGAARVAIPRGGSAMEARRFAERNICWIERQLLRQAQQPARPQSWLPGAQVLFRGEPLCLKPGVNGEAHIIHLGTESVPVKDPTADLRPEIERHLWKLASRELPPRVWQLAALHGLSVQRVSVRNQRSRWGSCSRRGTISLNWRLVRAPTFVCDYIILHELAHLKEMNHSRRFWHELARLCPDFARAEQWLKEHAYLLR